MDRQAATAILSRIRPQLEARGVAHAALFGSIAHGQASGASDIDVLPTPANGVALGLFDLGALQTILEDAFPGLAVDIVLAPVRKQTLRRAIERDAAHVF